jgi:ATP-dependent phosphofructokinase / diphosphate-dependent phosphofructokinase
LRTEIKKRFEERGCKIPTPVTKNIGYEVRCAPPIPFDISLAKDLGFGAIDFLLKGGSGALIYLRSNKIAPLFFHKLIDPSTGKIRIRYVDITANSYQVALNYMIRLDREDFKDKNRLQKLAETANLTPDGFVRRFKYLVE